MEVTKKLTIGTIITLLLAVSGTYYLADGDTAYHCQSKDLVMLCDKLSSGIGTRCYFESTYKICREGWKEIEIGQEVKIVPPIVDSEDSKWLCSPIGCKPKT